MTNEKNFQNLTDAEREKLDGELAELERVRDSRKKDWGIALVWAILAHGISIGLTIMAAPETLALAIFGMIAMLFAIIGYATAAALVGQRFIADCALDGLARIGLLSASAREAAKRCSCPHCLGDHEEVRDD